MSKKIKMSKATGGSRIAIIGTVGVPSRYGGFETLADNLVQYHANEKLSSRVTVYCSGKIYPKPRQTVYRTAQLRFLPLYANGVHSIPYDVLSMILATLQGKNRILLLGVSGAIGIPILRLFPWVKVVTNIDGIEWRRGKWSKLAAAILRFSERVAIRFSHEVIADNQGIADYIAQTYGRHVEVIAYGGDHALNASAAQGAFADLPENYALALCRIEPENNVDLILEAWTKLKTPLVFVGNWNNSDYGRELKQHFANFSAIKLVDSVYEPLSLRALRDRATLYVHGHSAGGTNPSLVEMMHFGIPVVAWDCNFNRYTTADAADYFASIEELIDRVSNLGAERGKEIGQKMRTIAQDRYTWAKIAGDYYKLLED